MTAWKENPMPPKKQSLFRHAGGMLFIPVTAAICAAAYFAGNFTVPILRQTDTLWRMAALMEILIARRFFCRRSLWILLVLPAASVFAGHIAWAHPGVYYCNYMLDIAILGVMLLAAYGGWFEEIEYMRLPSFLLLSAAFSFIGWVISAIVGMFAANFFYWGWILLMAFQLQI